jgi:hypothetical protein
MMTSTKLPMLTWQKHVQSRKNLNLDRFMANPTLAREIRLEEHWRPIAKAIVQYAIPLPVLIPAIVHFLGWFTFCF